MCVFARKQNVFSKGAKTARLLVGRGGQMKDGEGRALGRGVWYCSRELAI
jgi:hypothetical protein